MRIVGVDPGITGALARFEAGRLVEVTDMPVFDGRVNGAAVSGLLGVWRPDLVVVEDSQPMPKNGNIASFKLGLNTGIVIGVVQALAVALQRVRPATWKRWNGLIGKPKEASRGLVVELYPQVGEQVRLVKHHGRAEAVLIGRYAVYQQIQVVTGGDEDG